MDSNIVVSELIKEDKPSFVYLLLSSNSKYTYVGATKDVDHRLRQHNQEIKGGAVYTTTKVKQGLLWERVCYVSGFPTWQAALQFEWRWKQISRTITHKDSLRKRLIALHKLLLLNQSTAKAIPYDKWETKPEIHFTKEENNDLYHKINYPSPHPFILPIKKEENE